MPRDPRAENIARLRRDRRTRAAGRFYGTQATTYGHALGAVLHALVSGKKPHAELARLQGGGLDVHEAMKQLLPPLDTLVPGLPPAFVHAVARAVAHDVADRYPDALALDVALGEALVVSTARSVAEMRP